MSKEKPTRLDEATAWFAAMRKGVMDADERVAFDRWRADPRNQAALDELHELWGELAFLKYVEPSPLTAHPRKPRRLAIAAIAAAAIAAIGLSVTVLALAPGKRIETAIGEQRTQTLPDGSLIAVNVVSNVSYDFTSAARSVTVHEGEAAFNVKADSAKPFVVHVGAYDVRAIGTAFNIRRRDGHVEIAVSEGKVDLCAVLPGGAIQVLRQLGKGELLMLPAVWSPETPLASPEAVTPSDVAEWRMRVVSYEDAPLREIISDLGRYFPENLSLQDPTMLDRRLTIRLQIEDRRRAVETLAGLLGLRAEEQVGGTILKD